MKTDKPTDPSINDLKAIVLKFFKNFNKLPESAINPLMTGIFLLGMAATFFEPGMVAYLTMIFGASSGIAYAAAKNQTVHQLPTWAFPAVGVTAALVYAFAGVPGMVLTAGLSGGWYMHSHYSDKLLQWKKDLQKFVEDFKTSPVNQSVHVAFLALQFVSDFILKVEDPIPEEPEQPEEEPSLEEVIANPQEQLPEPEPKPVVLEKTIEQTAEKLEQVQKQVQEQAQEKEPSKEPLQTPTETNSDNVAVPVAPVLFSSIAPQQTNTASIPKPKTTTPKVVKPKTDAFKVLGQPVFEVQRMQVRVDNSWIGMGKAFFRSLDPRVDLVNEQGQNITEIANRRNHQVRL